MTIDATHADAPFRLGAFEVRPEANELIGPAGVARLPRLQMALLLRLVADAGRPVTRETLIADVWPRRGVTDEVLSRAVADLRGVLGDDARSPVYVETLPKLGYRLKVRPTPIELVSPAPVAAIAEPSDRSDSVVEKSAVARLAAISAAALVVTLAAIGWLWPRGPSGDSLSAQLAAAQVFASDVQAEVAPRFSPDGRRIAFSISDQTQSKVVVRTRSGETLSTIEREGGSVFSAAFFPDGARIAYWFRTPSDCGIVERRLVDGTERMLVPCADHPVPRFDIAPDGSVLVFAARAPERPSGLVHVELASGKRRVLTRPEVGAGDDNLPRFSPDGLRIAFFRGNDSQRELHVLSLAPGATPTLATAQRGLSYGAAWVDDRSLLVAADWFGFRALNHVDLASGEARLVGARGARFPDVARQGDIVYELASYSANLSQVAVDATAQGRLLWPSTRYSNQAAFAPDGRRIAFISNRDGALVPYVATLDGEPRKIVSGETHAYMRPRWSSDGRFVYAIAMPLGARGPQTAVKIDPQSGDVKTLPLPVERVWDVSPLDDGTLLVAESLGHAARLYRASASSPEKLERLPLPVVSQIVVSDGHVAFSQPQLKGVTLCTLPSLDCRRVDVPVGDANRFEWTLSRHAIWYGEARTLVRHDLSTGRSTRRALEGGAPIGTIAIASDERSAIVAREDRAEFDLMIAPRQR